MLSKNNNKKGILTCGRTLVKCRKVSRVKKIELFNGVHTQLENFCKKMGLNSSKVRRKILEVIVFNFEHFSIADLLNFFKRKKLKISKATLYRNLPLLIESKILVEGPTDYLGQIYYELAHSNHHDHIICLNCHQVFEFHNSDIEENQVKTLKKLHFKAQSHRHVIYAECEFLLKE